MKEPAKHPPSRQQRRDRLIHEWVHDPYQAKSKPPAPTVCPQCGAVFQQGRWTWMARPAHAHEEPCPACRRIRDKYPAGYLSLRGAFLQGHRQEILNLARHEAQRETAEHPLHRIMQIEEQEDGIVITTTDLHLPRRIAEALHRAYQGEMEVQYVEEGSILRAQWRREV
jgi:NMD protein affecting ribosome stability and mRNA decay